MLIDTATFGAGARRVAGVNVDDLDAVESRFVQYLAFEVVECPAMQCGSLRLSNRYPVADTTQIFQGNTASSALSLNHNALADAVVGVVRETRLFAGLLAQQATSRLCALLLQFAPQGPVSMAHMVDVAGLVGLAVA